MITTLNTAMRTSVYRFVARLALLLTLVVGTLGTASAQTVTYFHNDIAGTPMLATDAAGAVVWKENYLPYGYRQMADPASSGNKLWFTGKAYDPETQLSYMGARYYMPLLGRFTGIDPVEMAPEQPHSFNRYAYANNNPYKFVDPDGRQSVSVNVYPNFNPNEYLTGLAWESAKFVLMVAGGPGAATIKGAQAAGVGVRGAATVWDSMKATQVVWSGTSIPRSFELAAGNSWVWVHGNATEHLAEYAISMANRGVGVDLVKIGIQQQLKSLQSAVEAATAGGMTFDRLLTVGGWELKFAAPRAEGQLPALIHALPVK
ncbi:RHS repeat domain-containing protein [Acidovorax sp. Leaf78]|uniref:RHS repeat domain-containing protein n=1 Tax=unclassified Acidovorax TaxID=2684926 RepID=UPI0009E8633A|nr:RHS repeat-associated core domain-containing protein [Acidovorax sp. Leaf78]